MSEGKRRDPRAKVLSMTVRYKSATVDEFIENHSHDVSRGGIFIKTASPFPAGTLIKFEVRIDEERAVLQGVGRVVWKRDQDAGDGGGPAGMGVKFIKIGSESRELIDRVVTANVDRNTGAFEVGARAAGLDPKPSLVPTQPPPDTFTEDRPTPALERPSIEARANDERARDLAGSSEPDERTALDAPALDDIRSSDISGDVEDDDDDDDFDEESTAVHQAGRLLEEAFKGIGGKVEEAQLDEPQRPRAAKAEDTPTESVKAVDAPTDGVSPNVVSAPRHEPPKGHKPQAVPTTPPSRRGGAAGAQGGGSMAVWVLMIGVVVAAAVYLNQQEEAVAPVEADAPTHVSDPAPAPAPTPPPEPAPEPSAPSAASAAVGGAAPTDDEQAQAAQQAADEKAAEEKAAAERAAEEKAAAEKAAADEKAAAEKAAADEKAAAEKAARLAAQRAAAARAAAPKPKPAPKPAAAKPVPPEPAPAAPKPEAPAAPEPAPVEPAPPKAEAPAPSAAPAPAPAPAPAAPPKPPAEAPPTPVGDNPY